VALGFSLHAELPLPFDAFWSFAKNLAGKEREKMF